MNLLSKIQGCLLGVKIGDAMGMPFELMKPEKILEATKGEGVKGFCDPVQRKISGTMKLNAGDSTDDWQLTAANARSIIRTKGYDLTDCAREQVFEFDRCAFGWGSTTKIGLAQVKEYFEKNGASGRSPSTPTPHVPGKGCGNGVAMKIVPLAIEEVLNTENEQNSEVFCRRIIDHGLMTHPDPRASIAAYAVAKLVAYLASEITLDKFIQPKTNPEFFNWYTQSIRDAENHTDALFPERKCDPKDTFSARLARIPDLIDDPVALREKVGTGCLAIESVAFAIACFFRHPTDFEAGVLEAVNAGGDCDSTASICGALIGANVGLEAIPDQWRSFRPEYKEPLELGKQMFDVLSSSP